MKIVVASIAALFTFVLVIVVPSAVATSDPGSNRCLPAGVAVAPGTTPDVGLDAEQWSNAREIVATVVQRRMPVRAAVIAVAVALQESGLRDLPFGDADSLGLFQQRPSAGWGTPLQVMDPAYATGRFLDRLADVPSWPLLPLTQAAQLVQISAHPTAYAHWEFPATEIVNRLLGRGAPTRADPGAVADASNSGPSTPTIVPAPTSAGCDDGFGGFSSLPVGDCGFVLPRGNPRTCQQAVRWALAQTDGAPIWNRRCLNFVAQAYGFGRSGVENAALFWATAIDRHEDSSPPPGALVFWATGRPAGHVALAAGDGMVLSTDIDGAGTVGLVSIDDLSQRWNAHYLGWAPPFFPYGD